MPSRMSLTTREIQQNLARNPCFAKRPARRPIARLRDAVDVNNIGLPQHPDSLQSAPAHTDANSLAAALFSETRNQGVHEVNNPPISRANDINPTIFNLNTLASHSSPLPNAPTLALLADAAEHAAANILADPRPPLISTVSKTPVNNLHKHKVPSTPPTLGPSPHLNDSAYISVCKSDNAALLELDAPSPTPSDASQKQLCATLLPPDFDSASDGPATTPLNTPNDSEDELGDCSVQSALLPSARLKRPLFREDSPEEDEQIDQMALHAADNDDDDDESSHFSGASRKVSHNEHPHVKRKRQGQGNAVHGEEIYRDEACETQDLKYWQVHPYQLRRTAKRRRY